MRTKILVTAAAALAVGLVSSNAQVLSANVVGYVNTPLAGGSSYTLVGNPLDYGPGSNTVQNLFGNKLPAGATIQTWTPAGGFVGNQYLSTKSGASWQNPNETLAPGQGFFVLNPGSTVTNAFVGQVEQGNLVNTNLTTSGYSLISGMFPVTGGITTTFGYTPTVNDVVQTWTPASGFTGNQYLSTKSGASWQSGEPQLTVGAGYFIYTSNPNPLMSNTFQVQ